MKLSVYNFDGSQAEEASFEKFPSFEGKNGLQATKEVITTYQANLRQGNASTKTRAEVRGGTKKPYRQKGTGNARRGSQRSPILVGGGIVFGPKPRDYSKKINQKVKNLALRRTLFDRAQAGEISVIKELKAEQPKTKVLAETFKKISPKGSILLIADQFSDNAILALRNIERVYLQEAASVNALDLAQFKHVLFTDNALQLVLQRSQGE
ncbi:MAG: 50S ribosomal protein L4 [Opitutales bacterium]|nr:50S ribosomal protein L4 [Opitutales bacterium]MCH8539896.1 50S ribosomal protein L4 [Opitutales bacterium]